VTAQPNFQSFVHTVGQGPRRALALHCTMAFGGAWAGMAKALAGQVTFVAPDMPSHGKSDDWDEVSHLSDTAVKASLAAMDEAPMDVIGHSFGAMTALRLAVSYPDRVRSLTVIEPVFLAIARLDAPETMDVYDIHARPFNLAMASGDHEAAARAFNEMWSDHQATAWDGLPERTRAAMTRGIHVVTGSHSVLYDDDRGLLQPGGLDAVRIPTLILRGEHAHPAIISTNDGLAARISRAQQGVIEGAGHMAPISHPKQTAEVWQRFLNQH
jgi:pimeloyl-ACP methyl ester carboxylesterase